MRKIILWVVAVLVIMLSFAHPLIALAEDDEPVAEEQEEIVVEETTADEGEAEIVEPQKEDEQPANSEEEPLTEEKAREIVVTAIQEFLGQYMENSMLAKVITWLIDAGVISALVVIYIRYRKVKNKTIGDVIETAKGELAKAAESTFSNVGGEINPQLVDMQDEIKQLAVKVNAALQAFALAQDRSAEAKIAVLQLISQFAEKNEQTQAVIENAQTSVEEEEEKREEVADAVSGEYKPVDTNIW